MINHYVFWDLKEELSDQEKSDACLKIKRDVESLRDKIEGILNLRVEIEPLPSSSKKIALLSSFGSIEQLNAYQVHPEHVKAAGFIKSVTCGRESFDFVD